MRDHLCERERGNTVDVCERERERRDSWHERER